MAKAKDETTQLIESLEHWARLFKDGTLADSQADEIAYLLEDKAHDLRSWQKLEGMKWHNIK